MADVSQPSSLNLEPNPFEQSFASNTQQGHTTTAAPNDPSATTAEQPAAIQQDPSKPPPQNFVPGAPGLGQKTPIPGIDKMLTPLPLAPGATPFGHAGPLTSQIGIYGAASPAGWLAPRFGPITPGALNTPSLDAFGPHHGHNVQPHVFPHLAPGVHAPQHLDAANAADVNGVPRADAFGRPSQGVIPLDSPGITSLVGLNTTGVPSQQIPGVNAPQYINAPSVPENGSGPNGSAPAGAKPPGESAAANGLYMLSQNQLADKARKTPTTAQDKQREAEHTAPSPETKRKESQQQQQIPQAPQQTQQPTPNPHVRASPQPSRQSVDSNASSSVDETLSSAARSNVSRSRNNSSSRKRTSKEVEDADSTVKSDAGADDDGGDKRRWTNSQNSSDAENEEKRKQFLERNRIAAIKCRARKKQWVDNLQQKVDMYARANEELVQKREKIRTDFEELRQFIIRYHSASTLPQHILHLVQGSGDSAGNGVAGGAPSGREYGGVPPHVLPSSLPGAIPGHASLQPTIQPSVSSGPSGAQSMASSMAGSPASQRARLPEAHYQPHVQHQGQPHGPAMPQSTYAPPRPQQMGIQQPPMHHIHQTSPQVP